ncbi:MAG: pyridoxamine 5'-phosphate oxidase family protein [Verrucomicrobia bacterium]|nr:pyridoxamine 5'-phosphate oxidase family protein [Verrucomicrobiota bacterium]
MTLQHCIRFANDNQVCTLATADADQPHVRAFALRFADETGFYFHTGETKAVCRQLRANPKVEVCFHSPSPTPGRSTMMRVEGVVEFLDDVELKRRLFDERPFLKEIGTGRPEDPLVQLLRIASVIARFWTMADDLREAQVKPVVF